MTSNLQFMSLNGSLEQMQKQIVKDLISNGFVPHDDVNEKRPELPGKKLYGEWISVSEALPEYDEEVLVCDRVEPDTMWFAHRSDNPDVMRDSHQFCHAMPDLNVTHWMRIKQVNE